MHKKPTRKNKNREENLRMKEKQKNMYSEKQKKKHKIEECCRPIKRKHNNNKKR